MACSSSHCQVSKTQAVCQRQILEPLDGGHSLFFDTLNVIPVFVYRGSFLSKTDDKSGCDHILLSAVFWD